MVTGTNPTYVAGQGHRPIPLATEAYRKAHAPQQKKPTGLDWDNLTPRCKGCGQKSGQLDNTDTCPTCRGVEPKKTPTTKASGYASVQQSAAELESRFTAPTATPVDVPLEDELDDMADTDPEVAAAAAAYDDMADRVIHADDHVRASELTTTETPAHDEGVAATAGPQEATPEPASDIPVNPIYPDVTSDPELTPAKYSEEANLAAQLQHVTRVLTDTVGSTDPVVRLLRLNAFSAIEALHIHTILTGSPKTAAPAPSTPAGAAPSPTSPPPGLGGDRPAAGSGGEARRQPATRATRHDAAPVDEQAVLRDYADHDSRATIARRHGVRPKRITAILLRHRVELRDDRATNSGGANQLNLSGADVDVIRAAYVDDRDSIEAIATRTGHGRRQIADILRDAGVQIRPRPSEGKPITPELVDEFVARYQAGESLQRLVDDHHIKKDRVRHALIERGVEIRPSGGPQAVRKPASDASVVRAWAVAHDLMPAGQAGRLPNRVLDAYAAAHPTSPTGDTAA